MKTKVTRMFGRYVEVIFSKVSFDQSTKETKRREIILDSNSTFMRVKVSKYLSHIKDEVMIELYNLDEDIFNLIKTYDTVTVNVGYKIKRTSNSSEWEYRKFLVCVMSILIVTTDKSELVTPKTIIIGSSRYRKNQKKNALTIKTGTTLFNTLLLLCKRCGIRSKIDENLKKNVLKNDLVVDDENRAIHQLLRDYDFINVNNDNNGENYDIEFMNVSRKELFKSFEISPENGSLIKSWVSLDGDGNISFTSMANRYNYKIGDIISVDNKYFDQYVSSSNQYREYQKTNRKLEKIEKNNNSSYYIIIQLEYDLSLKGSYEVKITARPKYKFSRVLRKGF